MSSLSQLFSNRNTSKGKQEQNPVAKLFSAAPSSPQIKPRSKNIVSDNNQSTRTAKVRQDKSTQKRKNKIMEMDVQGQAMQEEAQQAHQKTSRKKSRNKSKGKNEVPEKQKKEDQQDEDLESTIFVGNVSLQTKKSQLNAIFSKYGKIVKLWFRSIPVEKNKMGPKASYILKKYKENADSMNAYVKFSTVEEAKLATKQNGTEFKQKTIRVSMCQEKDIDYKKTIFVGNLPFDIRQEDFRKHFKHIGTIENVRLIRNKANHQGIGIGYVKFSTEEQMQKALATMNASKINDRQLRVKRAVKKERLQKKLKKIQQKKQNKGKRVQNVKGYKDSKRQNHFSNDRKSGKQFSNNNLGNSVSNNTKENGQFSNDKKPINQFGNENKTRNSFNGQRNPRNSFNNDRTPRNQFTTETRPRNSFNGQRSPRNSFSNERKPRNSFNNQRNPQNSFKNDRAPRNQFNNDRKSRNSFNNDRKPRNSFNGQRNPRNSFNNDRKPRNSFNNDRKPRNSFNNERKPRNQFKNDRKTRNQFSDDKRAYKEEGFPAKRGKKIAKQQKISIQVAPLTKRIILS